ncbi:MAG TPA: hypothetical protein VG962_05095 [Steroidobacteraceae bacterium]|nr:hypothetical protein [Steroidobacteraceae bacterium]
MKVSVVDLRYKMNDVLKALERNEDVSILYHGKLKGVLKAQGVRDRGKVRMADHPFFNMNASRKSVAREMDSLRGGRYRDDF